MSKIMVVPLGGKGKKAGHCKEIELDKFNPMKHQLVGADVKVIVSRQAFHRLSTDDQERLGDYLRLEFGKVFNAKDPGMACSELWVQVGIGRDIITLWLPRSICDLYVAAYSTKKQVGTFPAVGATAAPA